MTEDVSGALRALRDRFEAARSEWGGVRLLLRVLQVDAGQSGRLTDYPPFATEVVDRDEHPLGPHPETALLLNGQRYLWPNAPEAYGSVGEGTLPSHSTIRWGLFCYDLPEGTERFLELAAVAGGFLASMPADVTLALRFELLDPIEMLEERCRWIFALFTLAWRQPQTSALFSRRRFVTDHHEWVEVPENLGERRRLVESRPDVWPLSASGPLDRFAATLNQDAFGSSVAACDLLLAELAGSEDESTSPIVSSAETDNPTEAGDDRSVTPDELRPARWFAKVTDNAIYADLLRRAGADGRLQREKRSGRWFYPMIAVCHQWPEYSQRIREANESERKRTEANI